MPSFELPPDEGPLTAEIRRAQDIVMLMLGPGSGRVAGDHWAQLRQLGDILSDCHERALGLENFQRLRALSLEPLPGNVVRLRPVPLTLVQGDRA